MLGVCTHGCTRVHKPEDNVKYLPVYFHLTLSLNLNLAIQASLANQQASHSRDLLLNEFLGFELWSSFFHSKCSYSLNRLSSPMISAFECQNNCILFVFETGSCFATQADFHFSFPTLASRVRDCRHAPPSLTNFAVF